MGLRIESFHARASLPLDLCIDGDELVGIDRRGTPMRGDALVGAVMTLVRGTAPNEERFLLRIDHVAYRGFWTERSIESCATPSPGCDRVAMYSILFKRAGEPDAREANLCDPLTRWPPADGAAIDVPPGTVSPGAGSGAGSGGIRVPPLHRGSADQIAAEVVMFQGDQYIEPGYLVRNDGASTWFNIACAGTAIGKLHLLRHTTASSREPPEPRVTRLAQRQTLLRMLTADYCGIGVPFTIDGHPLSYTFHQDWQPLQPRTSLAGPSPLVAFAGVDNASIDALWNEHGAVCIGTPRLSDREPEADLVGRIRQTCRLRGIKREPVVVSGAQPVTGELHRLASSPPRCDARAAAVAADPGVFDSTGSYAVSANPRPFELAR